MSLGGLLLGVINVAIVVAIFLLIGAVILMFANWMNFPIDMRVQKMYLLVVALIALYLLVALLLGLPTWRVVRHDFPPIGGPIPPPDTQIIRPVFEGSRALLLR